MSTFNSLPIFVALVEAGSFSKAGEQLNSSKSAVSKRISQLEDELGVRLFNRTTRSLTLTQAGEEYYDYASRALALAKEAEYAVSRLQEKPKGKLKISVPMTFGRLYIARLIPSFMSLYPDIQIEMIMDDKRQDFIKQGFDIGIRIGQLEDSSLVAKKIANCRSFICASTTYLEQHGRPEKPDDLRHHNCLYYSYFRAGQDWLFHKPGDKKTDHNAALIKVPAKGNYRVNNSDALHYAALEGLGIVNMPTFIVGPDILANKLEAILTDYPQPIHGIYAIFPERKHLAAKVRVFIDFLQAKIGSDIPIWDQGL
jgi:DNA-binding transcriptional LysR family regulator